jgi:hypothetical protein
MEKSNRGGDVGGMTMYVSICKVKYKYKDTKTYGEVKTLRHTDR